MASVQELIEASKHNARARTPLAGLLEGAASGFHGAMSQNLARQAKQIEIENERQDRARAKEMHDKLLQVIAGKTEDRTQTALGGAAAKGTPPEPGNRFNMKIDVGTKGYLQPTLTEKAKSLQHLEAKDKDSRDYIWAFDPETGRMVSTGVRAKDSSGGSGEPLLESERKMRNDFDSRDEVKDWKRVKEQVMAMDAVLRGGKDIKNMVGVDQSLISIFNKITDPQSVVRESEYARTPENLPMVNRMVGALEKVKKGGAGLTTNDREALVIAAKIIANSRGTGFNATHDEWTSLAANAGLRPKQVTYMPKFQPYDLRPAPTQSTAVPRFKIRRGQ